VREVLRVSAQKRSRDFERKGYAYTVGRCPTGKRCHATRASAKAHARRLREHLREYRCSLCDSWHVGHLPQEVLRGERTAGEFYRSPRPER
jgi:hypothetical protein